MCSLTEIATYCFGISSAKIKQENVLSLSFETVVNVGVGISNFVAGFATFVPYSLLNESITSHVFHNGILFLLVNN